jgi:hypothetical protein
MSNVTGDPFGRIPDGMRWCPRCNGYGSSLKEGSGRCTHCGGSGLVRTDRERPPAGRDGDPSAQRQGTAAAPTEGGGRRPKRAR